MRCVLVVGLMVSGAAGPVVADVPGGLGFCRNMARLLSEAGHGSEAAITQEVNFASDMQQIAGSDPSNGTAAEMAEAAAQKRDAFIEAMRPAGESYIAAVDLLKAVCPGD